MGLSVWLGPKLLRSHHARRLQRNKADFRQRREHLEAQFELLARENYQRSGFLWFGDFGDDVTFAKDRETGQLRALATISIHFEAIAGEGREEYEEAGTLRAATAMFVHDGRQWGAEGRTIMNLSPLQAVEYFDELEQVE